MEARSVFPEDVLEAILSRLTLENDIIYLTSDLIRDFSQHCTDKPMKLFNFLFCGGVVNGVVLFRWAEYYWLWNPAIREFKSIPQPRPDRAQPDKLKEYTTFFGMGFDQNCNDFKIIRSVKSMIEEDDGWEEKHIYEIYSLRANSWKRVESPSYRLGLSMNSRVPDGYFNGAYYWPTEVYDSETASNPCRFGILSFNFSTEVFKLVDAPPPTWKVRSESEWCIDKYKDFLAVIFTRGNFEDKVCSFDIWVVNKFDDDDPTVPLSWQNLFTIGPIPCGHNLLFRAFAWDGDMLLVVPGTTGRSECAFYNPTTCSLKRLGMLLTNCLRYVESLFPLSKF
ncbi:hypothetical protein Cgig2_011123 [Carnegiea gigantea]|uniref:F-box associated beta-propeller type 1 domain-containing protein n=1 Tax=Carnegiea gigantea TaxID=171969 RepID=A0A9Q1JUF4_9CARY|nr:hypothetical protein Cgig2_011123 [Carnegiea gigantea]